MLNYANVWLSVAGSVVRSRDRSEKPVARLGRRPIGPSEGANFARLRIARCRVGFPSVESLESEDRTTAHPNLTSQQWQAACSGSRKKAVRLYPWKLSPETVAYPSGQAGYGKRSIALSEGKARGKAKCC